MSMKHFYNIYKTVKITSLYYSLLEYHDHNLEYIHDDPVIADSSFRLILNDTDDPPSSMQPLLNLLSPIIYTNTSRSISGQSFTLLYPKLDEVLNKISDQLVL